MHEYSIPWKNADTTLIGDQKIKDSLNPFDDGVFMLSSQQYNINPTGEHNDRRKIRSFQDLMSPSPVHDPLCRCPSLPEDIGQREDSPQATR